MQIWHRRRFPRTLLEWIPAYVLAFLAILGIAQCAIIRTDEQTWEPIDLIEISVEPTPVVLGEPATLHNGICLRQDGALTVQVYMGLQPPKATPFELATGAAIDLVGVNVTGARRPVTLPERGCYFEEITTAAVPPERLRVGEWVVTMTVVATGPNGEMQFLTHTSEPFTIIAGR